MNKILFIGAILGLIAVIMGAYVDHNLANQLTMKELQTVSIALRYHQLYAAVISMIGFFIPLVKKWKLASLAGYLFIIGVLIFSFGIYSATIFNLPQLMQIVPLGGFILMAGWCCLITAGFSKMELANEVNKTS